MHVCARLFVRFWADAKSYIAAAPVCNVHVHLNNCQPRRCVAAFCQKARSACYKIELQEPISAIECATRVKTVLARKNKKERFGCNYTGTQYAQNLHATIAQIPTSGQTGSGKTYTMLGDSSDLTSAAGEGTAGLIPRICVELFQRFGLSSGDAGVTTERAFQGKGQASIKVSFCEVREREREKEGVSCAVCSNLHLLHCVGVVWYGLVEASAVSRTSYRGDSIVHVLRSPLRNLPPSVWQRKGHHCVLRNTTGSSQDFHVKKYADCGCRGYFDEQHDVRP